MLRLKSLTYTSVARPDLAPGDIRAIHETARHLNALDGVTGLLIYNGAGFLQVIEGAESAIDDLLQRLLADPRHSGLKVENERYIDDCEFPDWSMELVQVRSGEADSPRDLSDLLPDSLPDDIRSKALEMLTPP